MARFVMVALLGLLVVGADASGRDILATKKPTPTPPPTPTPNANANANANKKSPSPSPAATTSVKTPPPPPKCTTIAGCNLCPDTKKCTNCTGPAFRLKAPASSGQCVCAPGYGSYVNATGFPEAVGLVPTAAPNCGSITTTAPKLPKGPCTCTACPTIAGIVTVQPKVSASIANAVCNPVPQNCTGSWVVTGPCGSTCKASTKPTVFIVTRPARFGGYCEAANGTVGETTTDVCSVTPCNPQCQTCGATCTDLADNSTCNTPLDTFGTCLSGVCTDVCNTGNCNGPSSEQCQKYECAQDTCTSVPDLSLDTTACTVLGGFGVCSAGACTDTCIEADCAAEEPSNECVYKTCDGTNVCTEVANTTADGQACTTTTDGFGTCNNNGVCQDLCNADNCNGPSMTACQMMACQGDTCASVPDLSLVDTVCTNTNPDDGKCNASGVCEIQTP